MSNDYEPTEDINLKHRIDDIRRATTKIIEKKDKTTKKRFRSTKDIIRLIRSEMSNKQYRMEN